MSTILEIKNIKKSFENTEVLKGISLNIEEGEFITFLGSSGCGKTTMLRIIAGLEEPDAGHIILNGKDVTEIPPEKRDVNTVFQSYALFPHMNVENNIGYALKLRNVPKKEIHRRVEEVLKLVQLEGYGKRKPSELSGGQKQRVAIARAIINEPKVLLLDEPLGALDLQLRRQMQIELKRLQKTVGITFLYITHDQEEAINMSDRIVVMRNGQFEQIGTPEEIYHQPRSKYVAEFVGNANVLTGIVQATREDGCLVQIGDEMIELCTERNVSAGETVTFAVRSENIRIGAEGISAIVKEKTFAGGMVRVDLVLKDGTMITASCYGLGECYEPGELVSVSWQKNHAVLVDTDESVVV